MISHNLFLGYNCGHLCSFVVVCSPFSKLSNVSNINVVMPSDILIFYVIFRDACFKSKFLNILKILDL